MSHKSERIGKPYIPKEDSSERIQSFNQGIQDSIDLIRKHRLTIEEKNAQPEDGFHYFIYQAHIRKYEELEAELERLKVYL